MGVKRLILREFQHPVGQLDFVAGTPLLVRENVENLGLKDVAAVQVKIRRCFAGTRLFDHFRDFETVGNGGTLADDAIFRRIFRSALLDPDDVAAGLAIEIDEAGHAAACPVT
ncbi:hypothetical protein D9M72_622330 [compost metagenome]